MTYDLPPKIWLPEKPAIIRPAPVQKANFLPGMFPGMMMAAVAGGTPQETGFTLVGAGASVNTGAGNAWGSPGNITAEDGSNATNSAGTSDTSTVTDTLRGSTLGFALPGGATIDGIELRVRARYVVVFSGSPIISSVNLGKDDSTLATAKSPATALTTSLANYTFGSSSDLWGLSWTASEINGSTFQGLMVGTNTGFVQGFEVDAMWINVHYTA
jgi:hypothetical protein